METNPLIARGAFGRVDIALLVKRQSTIEQGLPTAIHSVALAAIKTIPNATLKSRASLDATKLTREAFAELNSLRLLNGHENVTPLIGYYGASDSSGHDGFGGWDWDHSAKKSSPTLLCLVFPYHPIDLHEALVYRRFSSSLKLKSSYFLPSSVVRSVMYDVLSGLNHLHSHCILHRDVKPGNLYITIDGRIQLGDFGLAKIVPPKSDETSSIYNTKTLNIDTVNSQVTNGLCTLQYRPPEVLLGATGVIRQCKDKEMGINGAFDIFSAGCIFAELLTLSGPIFPGQSVLDQLGRIFKILGTPTEENWPNVASLPDWNKIAFEITSGTGLHETIFRPDVADELNLLSTMLVLDPLQRSSARESLEQKLFQNMKSNHSSKNEVCASLLPADLHIMKNIYVSPNIDTDQSKRDKKSLDFAAEYAAKKASDRRNFVTGLNKHNECERERWSVDFRAATG